MTDKERFKIEDTLSQMYLSDIDEIDDRIKDSPLDDLSNMGRRRYIGATFYCDYCGKSHPSSELHITIEDDTKYQYKTGFLRRGVIERSTKYYSAEQCSRCHKIHNIAGMFHFLLGLTFIIIAIYPSWKKDLSFSFDHYIGPATVAVFLAYGVSIIDWLVIRLIWGVRRKPKKY